MTVIQSCYQWVSADISVFCYQLHCLCVFLTWNFVVGWLSSVNWMFSSMFSSLVHKKCCSSDICLSVYVMYLLCCMLQLCTKGIKVTIVCPGPIETPLSSGAASSSQRHSSEVILCLLDFSFFFQISKRLFSGQSHTEVSPCSARRSLRLLCRAVLIPKSFVTGKLWKIY